MQRRAGTQPVAAAFISPHPVFSLHAARPMEQGRHFQLRAVQDFSQTLGIFAAAACFACLLFIWGRCHITKTAVKTNDEIIKEIQSGTNVQGNLALLYTKNQPFILQKCSTYMRFYDKEDVMQEAYIIMHRAAFSYNPDAVNKAGFLTYLSIALKGVPGALMGDQGNNKLHDIKAYEQYMQLVENGKTKQQAAAQLGLSDDDINGLHLRCDVLRPGSLNAPMHGEDEEGNEAQDFLKDRADIATEYEEKDEKQRLKSIWSVMRAALGSGKHADVIEMYYRQGLSLTAAARQLGISSQRAAQIRIEAIKKLRKNQGFCSWAAEYTGYLYTAYSYRNAAFFHGVGSAVEFSAEQREKAVKHFSSRQWRN